MLNAFSRQIKSNSNVHLAFVFAKGGTYMTQVCGPLWIKVKVINNILLYSMYYCQSISFVFSKVLKDIHIIKHDCLYGVVEI